MPALLIARGIPFPQPGVRGSSSRGCLRSGSALSPPFLTNPSIAGELGFSPEREPQPVSDHRFRLSAAIQPASRSLIGVKEPDSQPETPSRRPALACEMWGQRAAEEARLGAVLPVVSGGAEGLGSGAS